MLRRKTDKLGILITPDFLLLDFIALGIDAQHHHKETSEASQTQGRCKNEL
jgi:hypothetical protein